MLQKPQSWKWVRRLGLLLVASCAGILMVLMATYLYLAPLLPRAEQLRSVDYQIPLRIYSSDNRLIGEFGEKRRTPLQYDQFPPYLVKAVLAAEDERFFRHGGVDMRGLFRAALELLRYQDIRSGGSTITMQVARNFFLDREQKFIRKFNEIVLAIEIENILSKEEILALYLNKIYLGHRAYGAEAAAQVYYGKSLSELSVAQLAMIAGLPKAPSAYNPITNPSRALTRRNWILGRMASLGILSEEQFLAAKEEPVTASYHGTTPDVDASYLAEMVRQDILSRYDQEEVYTSGLRVFVTLNSELQRNAVNAVRTGLHEYDERHGWRGAIGHIDLPAPALSDPEGDDLWAPIRKRLSQVQEVGGLSTGIVTHIDEQDAQLMLADSTIVSLSWANMAWAKPYKSVDYVGEDPTQPSDIFKLGDIVRLRPIASTDSSSEPELTETNAQPESHNKVAWRLAQVPQVESAMVSLDPKTGAINALVGGYSFYQSHFNRAVQGQRQAGSAFKPFIYSAGLLNGLTPASLINDAPIVFEDSQLETAWRPTGASSKFYGPTRIREALYRSLNLVSIRMLQQVGIGNAKQTLSQFGLPTERFPRDLSLALGSAALSPMELATAYCIFANGGYRVEPWFIERIEDRNNEVLWQAPTVQLCDDDCSATQDEVSDGTTTASNAKPHTTVKRKRAIDARTAWLMDSMMKDVVRRGTAYKASALGRHDLAGKTGTTNDQVDAWFSGYAPAMVATVWVGFDEPSTLGRGEYGGRAALPIWMQYMAAALEGVPEETLPQPPGIVTVRINPESGKRARPGDPTAIFEFFREENLPEQDHSTVIDNGGTTTSPEQLF
ncbi:MAG: penicillin-binding protein 1A [Gammaproteobacteria bacterium]|nr:penicillin-binding protein 1A [Gammaproteobacteria bacterium]MBQ0773389.1 penicillin-binding protein 1A [Gammaproteobacteria bacterium]